jgi:hypothetical protein
MKNLKFVKLFESFVYEELSPELRDKTRKAIKDEIDQLKSTNLPKRREQYKTLERFSPETESLRKKLEDVLKKEFVNDGQHSYLTNSGAYELPFTVGLIRVNEDDNSNNDMGTVILCIYLQYTDPTDFSKCFDTTFYGGTFGVPALCLAQVNIQKDKINFSKADFKYLPHRYEQYGHRSPKFKDFEPRADYYFGNSDLTTGGENAIKDSFLNVMKSRVIATHVERLAKAIQKNDLVKYE